MQGEYKKLILRGKIIVFIDWANVYGWTRSLKQEVDPGKLYTYLKNYSDILDIRLYFGTDTNAKSAQFLKDAEEIGYTIITKPVKYIPIAESGGKILRRKCDFDMEVCIDVHRFLKEDIKSFIFFTGDGDYEPLYKLLISLKRQIIVIYAHGHLGREIYQIDSGLYKKPVNTLGDIFKPK